jgi:hypothetical protein
MNTADTKACRKPVIAAIGIGGGELLANLSTGAA